MMKIEDRILLLESQRKSFNRNNSLMDVRNYIENYLILTEYGFKCKLKNHQETNYYEGCASMQTACNITLSTRCQLIADLDGFLNRESK